MISGLLLELSVGCPAGDTMHCCTKYGEIFFSLISFVCQIKPILVCTIVSVKMERARMYFNPIL